MHSFKQGMLKLRPLLLLCALTSSLSGCWVNIEDVTIPEMTFVTPTGGTLSAGCDLAHLISNSSGFLTEDDCLSFLQLQTHPDPSDPTQTIVDHYGAVAMSLDDFTALKTTLETACRDLGSHCSLALSNAVIGMAAQIDKMKSK